ncbi:MULTISPECIES: histidine phosphatase family protein [Paenibacillus]|uniref:histidine phosphatase family protein n=1 Tax=Paenibacillus TaxID=44249 RepID=UPI000477F17F
MEIIFIRHGQAEHNLPGPDRFNKTHPHLTELGKQQISGLQSGLQIGTDDLLLVSPMVRTIESAVILTNHSLIAHAYLSHAVGPRMYPQNPEWKPLLCDRLLTRTELQQNYPAWSMIYTEQDELGDSGINIMPEPEFARLAAKQMEWIAHYPAKRTIIISHDGTIQSYREFLGEQGLTRADFLGEAGLYKMTI